MLSAGKKLEKPFYPQEKSLPYTTLKKNFRVHSKKTFLVPHSKKPLIIQLCGLFVCWLVGGVGWLVARSVGWSVGRLVGCVVVGWWVVGCVLCVVCCVVLLVVCCWLCVVVVCCCCLVLSCGVVVCCVSCVLVACCLLYVCVYVCVCVCMHKEEGGSRCYVVWGHKRGEVALLRRANFRKRKLPGRVDTSGTQTTI